MFRSLCLLQRVISIAHLHAFHGLQFQSLEYFLLSLRDVESAGIALHSSGEDKGMETLENRREESVFKLDDDEGIHDVGLPQVTLKA